MTEQSYAWPTPGVDTGLQLIERQAQLVRAASSFERPLLSELLDPVELFAKLVREVEAGQVLVSLSMTASEQRLAALDALALARDVLEDARAALAVGNTPRPDTVAPASGSGSHVPPVMDHPPTPTPAPQDFPSDPQPAPPQTAGFPAGDRRASCACGEVEDLGDVAVALAPREGTVHGSTVCTSLEAWARRANDTSAVCDG